jgi:predicted nucleotidyltransferase
VSLAVTDEQRAIIRAILTGIVPDADYLAFGSRLGLHYHPYSDLDIAVKASSKIPLTKLSALEEAFAESDLPFRIDIVDLHRVSPEFRTLVEGNHVRL